MTPLHGKSFGSGKENVISYQRYCDDIPTANMWVSEWVSEWGREGGREEASDRFTHHHNNSLLYVSHIHESKNVTFLLQIFLQFTVDCFNLICTKNTDFLTEFTSEFYLKAVFQWCVLLYVRLRTCAQYTSMNEFTCSEHYVRIRTLRI